MKKLIAMLLCLIMILSASCVVANAEMPTVVMAFPTWTGRPAGADRIQERLSAITEEKLGVKLELEILDSGSYNQSMTLMLNSGEQVDIFNTLLLGYSNCVSKGYALGFLPSTFVRSAMRQMPLRAFSLGEFGMSMVLTAAYNANVYQPKYAKDYIQILKDVIREEYGTNSL